MSEDDEAVPSDIVQPQHFALRESDRGFRGALLRMFDELDDAGKQHLLQAAAALLRKGDRA